LAIDATGTPTALGIPTYNTAADAPSGKGLNAIVAVLDTLITAARGTPVRKAGVLIGTRRNLNFVDGSGITINVTDDSGNDEIDITIAASAAAAGIGTSFPGSPVDGQEYTLVDSLTAPTYAWQFVYVAGISDVNKWVFIGGAPGFNEIVTSESRAAAAAYGALATPGPSFTIPRAGIYEVTIGFGSMATVSSTMHKMSYDIGGTGAVDADAVSNQSGGSGVNSPTHVSRPRQKTIAAAATTLVAKYQAQGVAVNFQDRWMRVQTLRVA
jgi:hypothetical protein